MGECNPGKFIDEAVAHGRGAIRKKYPDTGDMLTYDPPRVVYDLYNYGSTAGPFGGIGGQMISSFPHVVVVWEYEYVYVYIGKGRGIAGRMTEPFQKAMMNQANPWTHAHHLNKA